MRGTSRSSEIPVALGSDVVYIEGHAGDSYLDRKSDVGRYREVHADARRQALSVAESRMLIGQYVHVHRSRTQGSGR